MVSESDGIVCVGNGMVCESDGMLCEGDGTVCEGYQITDKEDKPLPWGEQIH